MRKFRTGLLAVLLGASLAVPISNAMAGDARFDRLRAYLIYEDSGKLSKNIARRTDQIVANDENGTSTQMLVDLVVKGDKNSLQDPAPMLLVWVTDPLDAQRPAFVDRGWPLNFIGLTGEIVRSVVVDHDCGPVTIHTRLDRGKTLGREVTKQINITCGD